MPIDVAVLATTIVGSFLVPYVKLGAKKIAEGIAGKLGDAAAEQVTGLTEKIWGRVRSIFSSEGERFTLSQFEHDPEAAKGLVESLLRRKLDQDGSLAQEFSALVNTPTPDGMSTGAQIMNAHIAGIADARGADFSGSAGVEIVGVKLNKSSE